MRTVALAKEESATPAPILSPGARNFLERFQVGQLALRIGRAIRPVVRKIQNPIQRRIWIRQFLLPLRNATLLNRPLRVSFGDGSVFLVPQGSAASDIWTGLRHERHEVSFLQSILEPGMVFFDVGASAGLFAVGAAKRIGGRKVFAFEPCPATCEILKRNLSLNRVDNVHVVQKALGDSIGEGVLHVHARVKDGLNTLGQASRPGSRVIAHEKVRLTTLDTFVKERSIPSVGVIKADVEGAELMLFRGANDLLWRHDAPIILYKGFGFLTRGFGYHPVEILWFLESCGFDFFTLNTDTGEIAELKPDYDYNSMVIAAKPSHSAYAKLQVRLP
jgi:FkbM family methyltransferase